MGCGTQSVSHNTCHTFKRCITIDMAFTIKFYWDVGPKVRAMIHASNSKGVSEVRWLSQYKRTECGPQRASHKTCRAFKTCIRSEMAFTLQVNGMLAPK